MTKVKEAPEEIQQAIIKTGNALLRVKFIEDK